MKFKCTSIAILIFFMTFFLVGCGSSGGGGSDTDEAGKITVTATPENILTGGTSTISARVTDASGNPVDWELVSFSVDIGSFSSGGSSANGSDYTDDTGIATLTYYAPDNTGIATVTANTSDSTADPIKINIVPKEITVTATPENILTGGTSTISAKVTDKNGNPVDYELVTFAVDIGSFSSWKTSASDSDRTNDTGIATVTYYAPDNTGIATVTANTSDSTADPIKINIVPKEITVTATPENISTGGTSTISARLTDANGNPVASEYVSFSVDIGSFSSGGISANGYAYTDEIGIATLTYYAPDKADTATVTANTSDSTADPIKINILPKEITVTATPENISTGGTSTINAKVTDANGNPVASEYVTFSVNIGSFSSWGTSANGYDYTNDTGIATLTYYAPDNAGKAIVTAEASGRTSGETTIEIVAENVHSITVNSGSSSIVADGISSTVIRATVKDINGNNVADETPVTFTSTAGTLSDGGSANTVNGIAGVTLTSSNNIGTATIIATCGGVSYTTTVSFISGPPAEGKVNVTAIPANLTADGTSMSTIRVTVFDADDNPVADGEMLTFSAEYGVLSNLTGATIDGACEVTYTAPSSVPADDTDTVTVTTTNGKADSASIALTGPQIASIELTANPASIPADGSSQAKISAVLTLVGGGNAPDGTLVNFSITQGGGGVITEQVNTAGGVAIATLTSSSDVETVVVLAESDGRTAEIEIKYTPGSVELAIVPNSLLGTGEKTAVITAILKNAAGNPVSGESVEFSIDPLSLGSLSSSTGTTNNDGEAEVTFNAAAAGGTVVVTAKWKTGGVDVTGTSTIDIQPPPAFIEIAEGYPDPVSINIKGTGGQSTSQIIFDVKDSQGNPVADGYPINFSIDSGPNGNENIQPLSVATLNGQAGTILRSGSKSGPVSIKASYYYDTNISTTTSQIAINAGQPVGEEFGIFAQYLNISGIYMANLEDQISINAGDIYGNAIPDDTAISFKTYNTGGFFTPNMATTIDGLASNVLHSSGTYPEPLQGFVSVTAEANNGGRTTHVTSIAVTPAPDSNYIYAGTDGGGVYKSTNSGATWTNISRSSTIQGQNWIDPYVNDIDIDPDDPNTIYAATGYLGKGNLYRSLDGGMSWNSHNAQEWNGVLSTDAAVLTVLCDDAGSDYVWAGTEGLGAVYATDGETFYLAASGLGYGKTVRDIVKVSGLNGVAAVLYAATSTGIFKSIDGGNNWNAPIGQFTGDNITTLAIHPDMTNILYAGTEDAGVWVSVDNGINWDQHITGMGKGLSATIPIAYLTNKGNGVMSKVEVSANTLSENWIVKSVNTKFIVTGSISGFQTKAADVAKIPYTSDNDEVSFTISAGDMAFLPGDTFTFSTEAKDPIATIPVANLINMGNGVMSEVEVSANTLSEVWTVKRENTGFSVTGSISGLQTNTADDVETPYTSDNDEVSFTISAGDMDFLPGDTFTFSTEGLSATSPVADLSNTGNGVMSEVEMSENTLSENWTVKRENTGFSVTGSISGLQTNIVDKAEPPYRSDNDEVSFTISAGSTDFLPGDTFTFSTEEGLSATSPVADLSNTGDGVMSEVEASANTLSEVWTVECVTEFSITGGVSGLQINTAYDAGMPYTSDKNEVSFTISAGSTPFAKDDVLTFSTTRDPGRKIKDILVDKTNNLLYAITYFAGPLEPHAVGNVYVIELDPTNYRPTGTWKEANSDLSEYDPPDDITLFPQHVMVADDPDNLKALYIGGEGINLFKATSGLANGAPAWQASKSGLTNLIMSRMPILFSGVCSMDITNVRQGNTVTYTVYIEDQNGNPPISGSTFTVRTYKMNDKGQLELLATLLNLEYPDCYTHQGTFRDIADPSTNIPYRFQTVVAPDSQVAKVEFIFVPTCEKEAPGCSGAERSKEFVY